MVHYDGIWNDLELQKKKIKTRSVNGAFWRYLKRSGTAEIILKQGRFRVHYDTLWNDIWYCNEKNGTYFDLINVAWSRPAAIIEFFKIGGN